MATKSNRTAAPKLAIVEKGATSNGSAAASAATTETKPTVEPAAKAKGMAFWGKAVTTVTNEARDKMALLGDVRQRLEHARQLYNEGGSKSNEANEIAADAARKLYQGRAVINNDEMNSTLGDIFGYKIKGGVQMGADGNGGSTKDKPVARDAVDKDGKAIASKTPFGPGEAIRKRIVRAKQAASYAIDGEEETFFTGLPVEEITEVLEGVEAGELSLWTAYDKFAKIKAEHTNRVEMAFDPKKINTITEALASDGAAAKLNSNGELMAAYKGMIEVLNILGEALAEMDEAA